MYDRGIRLRAVEYVNEGNDPNKAAKIFKVGVSSIYRWKEEFEETGGLHKSYISENRTFKKIDPEKLKKLYNETPDLLLKEAAESFSCSIFSVWYNLQNQGYTFKKKKKDTEKPMK